MRPGIPKGKMVLQGGKNRAMILAAGLGTRLRPMTDDRPKALVEWQGKALLDYVVEKLRNEGFSEIIINVHHFAEKVMEHVKKKDNYGLRIEFSHEKDELLDTGGGIAKASWFLREGPFLVYNVDILSNISLGALMEAHRQSGAIATMAVKERVTSRSLLMNNAGYLKGWRDNRSGETILCDEPADELTPIAFSAIHVMNPEVFDHFPGKARWPIMPFYLELARTRAVKLYRHDADRWTDMGKLESFANS